MMAPVETTAIPEQTLPLDEIWQMVLEQIRFQVPQNAYTAYFRETRFVYLHGATATLAAPSPEARAWIASRMTSTLQRQLSPLIGCPVEVCVVDQADLAAPLALVADHPVQQGRGTRGGGARQADMARQADAAHQEDAARQHAAREEATRQEDVRRADAVRQEVARQEDAAHLEDPARIPAQPATPVLTPPVSAPAEPQPGLTDGGGAFEPILLQAVDDTLEGALQQQGKIIAFPRYELRFIPLVGPEAFFLRLAFLQERYFHTPNDGRAKPFETSVEALLRWANVGRATLHRFKKGDPARGQPPAAAWFGIEQLPSGPRSANAQQQPPCRYRVQQGIPLTPMDADRLYEQLIAAGIQRDPLQALQTLCERPLQEILQFPPPAPTEAQKKRAPVYTTPAGVVQQALAGQKIDPDLRPQIQEWASRLAEHITLPQQLVFVSWYFLRHWLPILGHDAAALVLYARAQGYYNPQSHELRDVFAIPGGYRELAGVIGLKRDRTIGDWLPNLFERKDAPKADSEKWQREQQRQQQIQDLVGQFIQVVAGSRWKTAEGHYGFQLRVEIQGEPLTPPDQCLCAWVRRVLDDCAEADVLDHFHAWVTSAAVMQRGRAEPETENDGAGILGSAADPRSAGPLGQNDGWGILAARAEIRRRSGPAKMTARESGGLDNDGWGILERILNDGWGMLAPGEMTAGELFKGLFRLNTSWETILQNLKTTPESGQPGGVVVRSWDLRDIFRRNGGMTRFREEILARESSPAPFLSWLYYAYSFKGKGIDDPLGWALTRLRGQPGLGADGVFTRLAQLPPERLARLLRSHLETGVAPLDEDWSFAFRDSPIARLRQLAEALGLEGEGAGGEIALG